MLGSIHAADDTAYPLKKSITESFDKSDYLAVELDMISLNNDFEKQLSLAKKMMYNDGTTIKDHLGDDLYNSMVSLLTEKEIYNSFYDNYKPVFFESLIENEIIKDANMDTSLGIDMHFLKLAKEKEMSILEIESADFQYDLLLSFGDELEKINIESYIENYDENVSDMRNTYEAWKKGNLTELEQLLSTTDYQSLNSDELELVNNYERKLITERNYNMANTLTKYIDEGKNVFCIVGLGHVIGEDGIISLMKKDGYTIEKL